MSDAAVTAIVTGVVTTIANILGFLAILAKMKYANIVAEKTAAKTQVVEKKLDANTVMTAGVKKVAEQTASDNDITATTLAEHHTRIAALESQMGALKGSIEVVTRAVDSMREEQRVHNQSLLTRLDMMQTAAATAAVTAARAATVPTLPPPVEKRS